VTAWQVVRLPAVRVPVPMWFGRQLRPTLVRDEPRVAVAASVESPLGPLVVATTHLSFLRWWNAGQLRHLRHALAGVRRPLLLTGDLNMSAERAERATGMTSLARHPTFPADEPTEQLDHVLLDASDGSLRVAASDACRMPLSDHRALVVDLRPG
jgi:endonuclease/exonuclease/phosphatase family metal-dependent hydrolase